MDERTTDLDPTRAQSRYDGEELQPKLPNNTELFILGIILLWIFGAIAANH